MKRVLFLALLLTAGLLASCTDPKGAAAFLEREGFTEVKAGGFDLLARGKTDLTTTRFTARSAAGQRVVGAVSHKGPISLGPKWVIRIWREEQ